MQTIESDVHLNTFTAPPTFWLAICNQRRKYKWKVLGRDGSVTRLLHLSINDHKTPIPLLLNHLIVDNQHRIEASLFARGCACIFAPDVVTSGGLVPHFALAIDMGLVAIHLVQASTVDHHGYHRGAIMRMRWGGRVGRKCDEEGDQRFSRDVGRVVVREELEVFARSPVW